MLDGVGDVHRFAIDAGLLDDAVEQTARGADEGVSPNVLLVTGLLAHQHNRGIAGAFPSHGLRGSLPQIASMTVGRALSRFRRRRLQRAHEPPPLESFFMHRDAKGSGAREVPARGA